MQGASRKETNRGSSGIQPGENNVGLISVPSSPSSKVHAGMERQLDLLWGFERNLYLILQ